MKIVKGKCTFVFSKCFILFHILIVEQKIKFSIRDIFCKCNQIHRVLRIWSHLLKKSLIQKFVFVQCLLDDWYSHMVVNHFFFETLSKLLGVTHQSINRFTMLWKKIYCFTLSPRWVLLLWNTFIFVCLPWRSKNSPPTPSHFAKLELFWRKRKTNINDIVSEIQKQFESSLGYRTTHQQLWKNKVTIETETIAIIMKSLHSFGVGVFLRSCHKLRRRTYRSQPPNFIWHIDVCDKLNSSGLTIHDVIDRYSYKILRSNVVPSKGGPKIIQSFRLNDVVQSKVTQKIIRADK